MHLNHGVKNMICDFLRYWRRRMRIVPVRHDVFVSLGYNCELAFRYNLRNGFVDTGLFQWSYARSIDGLIYALEHLDQMYAGNVKDPDPLYECENTGIRQHGKASMSLWLKGVRESDRATMLADKADLIGRMAHLKEKFVGSLRAGGALVAYKVRTDEMLSSDAADKFSHLLKALQNLGANGCQLLLICEERCFERALAVTAGRAAVRAVSQFNPDDNVANKKLGDKYGWRLIFDEFAPKVRRKNKHKFKFEK